MAKRETMTDNPKKVRKTDDPKIDFTQLDDIVYWTKKWEISAHQLNEAIKATGSNKVRKIEEYLRSKGFAI